MIKHSMNHILIILLIERLTLPYIKKLEMFRMNEK